MLHQEKQRYQSQSTSLMKLDSSAEISFSKRKSKLPVIIPSKVQNIKPVEKVSPKPPSPTSQQTDQFRRTHITRGQSK